MVDGSGLLFAYCPERIAPGNSLQEFKNNDRIVGTENAASRRSAFKLLKKAIKGRIHFTDIQTAETTKLVENAARDVYIAFANDLAKIGTKIGVDSMEVIRLANTHPRVKILNPGPGVGGPCLTKDPYLLLEGMPPGESGAGTMVRTARAVNDSMKDEILALVDAKKLPNGSKVAVLGTSYKPDIDDPRGSPSEPIIAGLLKRGLDVFVADPHCSESFGAHRSPGIREAINGASCVLFLVAHSEFKGLDAGKLARLTGPSPVFIDAVGVLRKGSDHTRSYALLRLGDGRGPGPRD